MNADKNKSYICGSIKTSAGEVSKISTELTFQDVLGGVAVRWGNKRMDYRVPAGIYAVGCPGADACVFVSSNYKLSFDILRKNLSGLDGWLLVLDTKGVNVWCAAGKGTFGTKELVSRIQAVNLDRIVDHKKLILPQLSATGVSVHETRKLSGFNAVFGPIKARDIKRFIQMGFKTTADMRKITFSISERFVLVPMELSGGFKYIVLMIIVFSISGGLSLHGYSLRDAIEKTGGIVRNFTAAYAAGAVAGPLLLPWLPGRSFSVKGVWAGVLVMIIMSLQGSFFNAGNALVPAAWILIITAISSFMVMNFTGASPYTSLSGVRKEMRIAVPLQAAALFSGTVLWLYKRLI
ncbi:mercury methylation corrinoid protein HgcA [Elusimicrobiota bacterium]